MLEPVLRQMAVKSIFRDLLFDLPQSTTVSMLFEAYDGLNEIFPVLLS